MDEELQKFSFFQVNPNLIIQVLSNFNDNYFKNEKPSVQAGLAAVKVTDKTLGRETIFVIHGQHYSPALTCPDGVTVDLSNPEDWKKMIVSLEPVEFWDRCEKQREFLNIHEGETLFHALLEECQKIYERVLRENPEWLK
ncbi:MAG: hypothetical protein ACOYMB_01045 [Patescibacteria group bacterium]